ncbi:unnamed protein product, partial [Tenebrio molitor]
VISLLLKHRRIKLGKIKKVGKTSLSEKYTNVRSVLLNINFTNRLWSITISRCSLLGKRTAYS